MKHIIFVFLFFISSFACAGDIKLQALYRSLDPYSILENFAFYELYPDTEEGSSALKRAWSLLAKDTPVPSTLSLPDVDLKAIVALVTRQPTDTPLILTSSQLQIMDLVGTNLANRTLLGYQAWSEEEMLALPSEEVDVARGVFLCQFAKDPDFKEKIRQYEAAIDLMALQIRARCSDSPSPEELIEQINRFIFLDMGFRFPPHSLYAKDVDLYTFLPSVLDSRRGVCLGVSILYLSIAQRLNLNLEVITPPGHIYLRYQTEAGELNIETTARGINLPSETYLGINIRSLQKRTQKEVIGMALVNHAAVCWGRQNYKETVALYEQALPYLEEDTLVRMFLGMNYLFINEEKKGKALLKSISPLTFDYAVSEEVLVADYLNGRVDAEGLKTIFLSVDETRSSIEEKKTLLEKTLKKYPKFRAGLLQLAITHLQLSRSSEAMDILLRYHALDPNDATVEYYLSILSLERLDYPNSLAFLKQAIRLTSERNHNPKALKSLRSSLLRVYPSQKKPQGMVPLRL